MKNTFLVFLADLKAIFSHIFSIVILIAVLVIPALYAWVNIYANWDPYGNTGNVPIALASRDRGYTDKDGRYVNRGREIVDEVSQSTSIRWIVIEDADEAIEGVRRGDWYGALVMGENLSRNMYDLKAALEDHEPSIIFYQNAKTNAIANKITSTAAGTVEYNIQVKYLSVLISQILNETEDMLDEQSLEELLDHFIEVVTDLRDHLDGYIELIDSLRAQEGDILAGIDAASSQLGGVDISDTVSKANSVKTLVTGIENEILIRLDALEEKVQAIWDEVNALGPGELSAEMAQHLKDEILTVEAELEALIETIPDGTVIGSAVESSLRTLLQRAQSLEQALNNWTGVGDDTQFRSQILTALEEMSTLMTNQLRSALTHYFDTMTRDMELLVNILSSVNTTIGDIQPVLAAAKSAVIAVNGSLAQLETALKDASAALDRLLDKLTLLRDSDLLQDLIDLLHGDPDQFAEFFAQPVTVTTETIYPVENYGTAMAPFYTTLAIWVGCVVTGAIIKAEAEPGKLKKPRPNQLFFGRFLTFFLIGQIQTVIIVAGDIWLLGCQCVHPGLFFLSAAVASLVFNMLMYALTATFGDIGKAIGVVIMIVQIAGSSGSYPIEILPEIFGMIYTFFPFPYAINAMREALCGLYRYDLLKYLGELMVFGVFGLLIGLRLRGHFAGVNVYVEEEMEETGVL